MASKRKKTSLSASDSSEQEESSPSRKKSKSHKKSKKAKKEKLKEAKRYLKQSKGPKKVKKTDDKPIGPDFEIATLTSSDYFEKNPEFTSWLKTAKGIFFNELPGSEARQLFEEFVLLWNGRRLPKALYEGISPTEARRSQHSWGIKAGQAGGVALGLDAAMEEEHEAGKAGKDPSEKRRWKHDSRRESLPMKGNLRPSSPGPSMQREEVGPSLSREATARGEDGLAQGHALGKTGYKANQPTPSASGNVKEDSRLTQLKALAAQGPIQITKRT